MKYIAKKVGVVLAALVLAFSGVPSVENSIVNVSEVEAAVTSKNIPSYKGSAYKTINDNQPEFSSKQKKNTSAFEKYSKLDSLGRCGVAFANICEEIEPTEARGDISSVKPSGWTTGKQGVWQRCHLIGFQLAGENANKKNLVTGTKYMNVTGMLPFESMIDDYVDETGNHVLYRVTPVFKGNELVCRGVQMEAYSVEDKGAGVCFNVFCFNVQPGYSIDYKQGGIAKGSNKASQYITVKTTSKSYKVSTLAKEAKTFSMGVSCKTGSVKSTKNSGSKYLSVSSKGKVTVKKSTPAGTYKAAVKISVSGSKVYQAKTIYKTVKVTVKA